MKRKSSVGWRDLHDLTLMVSAMRKMAPKTSQGQPGMLGELLDPNDFSGCESLLEAYFLQVWPCVEIYLACLMLQFPEYLAQNAEK